MATGRTIRVFLADGTPTGTLVGEIINWTGKVLVSPRTRLPEFLARDELSRPGVYVLLGQDPETRSKDRIYVGEGENVRSRLLQHDKADEKEFWERTVSISSKDENLTKGHVRYLESRLLQIARESQRAEIANATAPDPPPMPESDRANMEFFLEQVRVILPILGVNFVRPRPTVSREPAQQADTSSSPLLVLEKVGVRAEAQEVEGEYVVREGSTARKEGVPSWEAYTDLREELVEDGKLRDADEEGTLVFTEDVAFSSPSAAAAVICGRNISGRTAWRLKDTGETLKSWQQSRLPDSPDLEATAGSGD